MGGVVRCIAVHREAWSGVQEVWSGVLQSIGGVVGREMVI